jgi:ankyrin repeat protein
MPGEQPELMALLRAIASRDPEKSLQLLNSLPQLAVQRAERGASRQESTEYFFTGIGHYLYAGDSALHFAAAGYQTDVARALVAAGAEVTASNRRGAQPLHYAADGGPGTASWNPPAQAATIALLVRAGADPNALDKSGVAPLHRAVRTRCTAAVQALLDAGADPALRNGNGSTPLDLATRQTGRGGSGSPQAKAEQADIIRLLQTQGVR